jgi:5-methylcytosine-specific restriction endonuclease McrA
MTIDTLFRPIDDEADQRRFPPALVLNGDHLPLSYTPLSLWSWHDVVRAITRDVAVAVSHYDIVVRSPSTTIQLPSVIALRDYVRQGDRVPLSRYALTLRDDFSCSYCGAREMLTFDHVVPRASNGLSTWENLTSACEPCNRRKGSKSLAHSGMTLRKAPHAPTRHELARIARRYPPAHLHEDWRSAAYWDAQLEP